MTSMLDRLLRIISGRKLEEFVNSLISLITKLDEVIRQLKEIANELKKR